MERFSGAVLIRRDQDAVRILLGRRAANRQSWPDAWDVIGGHCEPGETPEQTLARELREELGVTPTTWHRLAEIESPGDGPCEAFRFLLFAVTAWEGNPENRDHLEHSEVAWFTAEEACRLDGLAHAGYPAVFREIAGE